MRCFLFCFALIGTLLINCSAGIAQEDADVTIDSDLVEILDSFDKKDGEDPYAVPKLSDILEAKGTVVFFDNTNSSGKKPTLGGNVKTKQSNVLQRTLERARRRLFGSSEKQQQPEAAPVFSDRTREPDWFAPQTTDTIKPRFLSLDYDGEKTVALIPPDTFIEVPYLKHIPYFFSRIEILGNGSIKVTETIERVVEPKETDFRGIERYFPKYHSDRTGKQYRTDITVLEAFVDNAPIQAKLLPDTDGIKMTLHSDDPLKPGTHLYQTTYLLSNKIAEFKNNSENAEIPDFKELIWEVTGSHWDIPVMRAGAVMIFPPESILFSQAAITSGPNGYGHNYKIRKDKENNLSFVITFPLAPYEGLTILANWAEKNPAPMFQNGKLDRFIIEHGTAGVALIAFLFILSYYLATWLSLRKNQEKSDIKAAPLQKGDLTPAVLNYALNKKISPKSLFIILLNMASKGFLAFDEQSDGMLLLIKQTDKETGLTPLEKKVAGKLFIKESTSFALTNANVLRLKRLMSDIEKSLLKEYRKKFTVFPQTYFWFGILMAVIAAAAISSMSLFPAVTALTSAACAACLIPATVIATKTYTQMKGVSFKENKLRLLKTMLVMLLPIIVLAVLFVYYSIQTTPLTTLFFFALLICIGIFKVLLRSPSVLGNSILENMEGYKLYLSSQDDTLLNVMRNAEQKIKSLYSKHLPFAAAMGLDQLWTRRFVAFSETENQLKPDWYKGKLPFADTFVEALYTEFAKAFPQENASKRNGRKSRFKKQPS